METCIALLRGINVSGQKQIKMADLKILFEALGFQSVQTYIQSGNVVFRAAEASAEAISAAILDRYGFEVAVLLRTPESLERVLAHNPFLQRGEDPEKLYVTFLAGLPPIERVEALRQLDYSPEEWALHGDVIYFFAPNGYGRAKMNNNFFENKLKTACTTRNWKTVGILFDMAKQ